MRRVEVLSDWKALSAALLEDTAVEARSEASSSNLVLLLRDAAHKGTGGQLVPSRQEARLDDTTLLLTYCRQSVLIASLQWTVCNIT